MKCSLVHLSVVGFGVLGCHADFEAAEVPAMVRVTPAAVAIPDAWKLFDRSLLTGYVPEDNPVAIELDRSEQISAITYRLTTSRSAAGVSGAMATVETNAAFSFAQRAWESFFR